MANAKKSTFFQKMGAKVNAAHNKHKGDETNYGNQELPPLEGGVAQLDSMEITTVSEGKKNAGQFLFRAVGIVQHPEFVGHQKVRGQRTQLMELLCDTPDAAGRKTFDEHYAWVLNEIRKFGVNTEEMKGEDLEDVMKQLSDEKPYFMFRVWKGKPNKDYPEPRVNHQWNGRMDEGYDPGDVASGTMADNSPEPNAEAAPTEAEESGGGDEGGGDENTATEGGEFNEFEDLSTLLEKANEGDEDAHRKLKELAVAAGVEEEAVDNAGNWQEVVDLITAAQGSGEGEATEAEPEPEPEPEKPYVPKKGDVVSYKVIDPKTKKPLVDPKTKKERKPVEVEIVAVNTKTKTVDLKNNDDGKTLYKGVPFASLIRE